MKKFWNWIHNEAGGRVLRLEGPIDDESFWGDGVTPKAFREELNAGADDITVWINSPGGNVFAAAEIYTMLRDYPGSVTVKIDAIAASAASVIAMAGNRVLMSPVAMLMIHDPSTIAMGNAKDMEKAIATLNEVKESIINAYAARSGLSHSRIARLMENETWMNARKAVELGFADEILFGVVEPDADEPGEGEHEKGEQEGVPDDRKKAKEKRVCGVASLYSSRQMGLTILNRLGVTEQKPPEDTSEPLPRALVTPAAPVIDLDGKTEDGSMPFGILIKQLELMR